MKQLNQAEILAVNGSGEPDSNHIIMASIGGIAIGVAVGASLSFRGTYSFVMGTLAMGGFIVARLTEESAIPFGTGVLAMNSAAITTSLAINLH